MSLDGFEVVNHYKNKLDKSREKLEEVKQTESFNNNQKILDKLADLLKKLKKTEQEDKIKQILVEASKLENFLRLDHLNYEQQKAYQALEKSYQEEASSKNEKLNKTKYEGYNKQVAKKLKKVYQDFKAKERAYKKEKQDIIALIAENMT